MNTNEWQPIETAPKDGTEIVVYVKQIGQMVVYYDKMWTEKSNLLRAKMSFEPTHWMPLPQPPTK